MDPGAAVVVVTIMMLVLLALSVDIGVALGLGGLLGLYLVSGETAALGQLRTIPYSVIAQYALAVIPMFILMGALASEAGLTTALYHAGQQWLGGLRGGLALATTAGAAAFGAVTGSSVVCAAVFTRISMPEMIRAGYDKRLSAGCVAAAGTLAALIPPSIMLMLYGIVTEQSIGKLLMAAVLPGLLSAVVFMVGISVLVRWKPHLAPLAKSPVTWRSRFESLRSTWALVFLFACVMGGIYTGLVTATQAGAVGAVGAFFLTAAQRRLRWAMLKGTLLETGNTGASIFIILIGGTLFARFLSLTGIIQSVTDTLLAMEVSRHLFLLAYLILFLVLGTFLEAISIMVMVLPVLFPVLTGVGYDPIWLGIISVKMGEIATVSPPVGLTVNVVKSASPVPLTLEDVFLGTMPFMCLDLFTLAVLIAFPDISLLVPRLMG